LDARSGMPCAARLGHRHCEETARQAIITAIYIDKCGMVHDTSFLSMIITLKRSVSKYPTNERHWLIVNRGQILIVFAYESFWSDSTFCSNFEGYRGGCITRTIQPSL
jgi:hypothetical protein